MDILRMTKEELEENISSYSIEDLNKMKEILENNIKENEEDLRIALEQVNSSNSNVKSEAYSDRKYANEKIAKDTEMLNIIKSRI